MDGKLFELANLRRHANSLGICRMITIKTGCWFTNPDDHIRISNVLLIQTLSFWPSVSVIPF
jgi:hypothetical protein